MTAKKVMAWVNGELVFVAAMLHERPFPDLRDCDFLLLVALLGGSMRIGHIISAV
jgi:hypothetical protein